MLGIFFISNQFSSDQLKDGKTVIIHST